MIKIAIPTTEICLKLWKEIEPFIQKAIDHSNRELDMEDIMEKVRRKELLVATIFDESKLIACCSFEMVTFASGKKTMHIHTAGGERSDEWFERIDEIATELARLHNCNDIYIIGRKAWERKMKPLGYKHTHTIISKEVN